MRQKRAKTYRKLMNMYCLTFGFRQPYQVLVDSEMCKAAISRNHDFVSELGTVLHGTVKPMITQCCIHELYLQGKSQQPAVDLAKAFERRKCNHKEAIPGDECLASVIGETNKHRYVIATQSQPLRVQLRAIAGVPIVHIDRSVMILEPPSDITVRAKVLAEQNAMAPSTSEAAKLKTSAPPPPPVKKRKGPKAPNPLSVKKKKTVEQPPKKTKDTTRKVDTGAQGLAGTKQKNVGEKRKRGDDDDDDEVAAVSSQGGAEAKLPTAAHKRRRRRKATAARLGKEETSPEPVDS